MQTTENGEKQTNCSCICKNNKYSSPQSIFPLFIQFFLFYMFSFTKKESLKTRFLLYNTDIQSIILYF